MRFGAWILIFPCHSKAETYDIIKKDITFVDKFYDLENEIKEVTLADIEPLLTRGADI